MKIFLSDRIFDSFVKLTSNEQKSFKRTLGKMKLSLKSNGLKFHKLPTADCDDTFRSIRVNEELRIIASSSKDRLVLLYVGHHEDAYNWAAGKYLKTSKFNSSYIYDEKMIINSSKNLKEYNFTKQKSVFEGTGLHLKDLIDLGINAEHAQIIINITDLDYLIEYIGYLPEEIKEALVDLALGNKDLKEIYNDLNSDNIYLPFEDPNTMRRFVELSEEEIDNLESILKDFGNWKIFLHPNQKKAVTKKYNGPALIEGGPGTGKTVLGLHRMKYLTKNIYTGSERLLFCTFNKRLSLKIKSDLTKIIFKNKTMDRIDVVNFDSLVNRILKNSGRIFNKYFESNTDSIIEKIANKHDQLDNVSFIKKEFYEVIQKNQIKSIDGYLGVKRIYVDKRLNENKRRELWKLFDEIIKIKTENDIYDFDDRAYILNEMINNGEIKPIYHSIIIDEAQDLSKIKLIALNSLLLTEKNNIFILSDHNQRIYGLYSWESTGLNVRGRTSYLTLNYRTTKEIQNYAQIQFNNKNEKERYEREYKSLVSGAEPIVKEFNSFKQLVDYIHKCIKILMNENCLKLNEISIITSRGNVKKIIGAFDVLEIPYVEYSKIKEIVEIEKGVNILMSYLAKGLEYRVVFVVDIEKEYDLLSDIDDEYYMELEIKKFDCLKYVALTRAREILYVLQLNS